MTTAEAQAVARWLGPLLLVVAIAVYYGWRAWDRLFDAWRPEKRRVRVKK